MENKEPDLFITFHCDAYENISYFTAVAKNLIRLLGHGGSVPGAIKANELPEALNHLQKGLGVTAPQKKATEEEIEEPDIDLAKRAVPLLQLLQAAIKKECDVIWSYSKYP